MSLLMEALKKAEQSKNGAAEAETPRGVENPGEIKNEPWRHDPEGRKNPPVETTETPCVTSMPPPPQPKPATVRKEPEAAENTAPEVLELTLELPEEQTMAAERPAQKTLPPPVAPAHEPELEPQPVARQKAPEPAVSRPASAPAPDNKSTPGPEIKPAGIRPPPGVRPMMRRAPRSRPLLIGILLLGTVSVLGGGYLYLDSLLNRSDGDFVVALPWSRPAPAPVTDSFDPLEASPQTAPAPAPSPAPAEPAAAPTTIFPPVSPATAGEPPAPAEEQKAAAAVTARKTVPAVASSDSPPVVAATAAPQKRAPSPAPAAPAVAVAERPIRITRKKRTPDYYQSLQRAFHAYQAGDLRRAEQAYQTALKYAPKNRDALLGLAAIARRRDDVAQAREYYQDLLVINPADSRAISGLIELQTGDAVQSESNLKLLLDTEPEAPHLHFALGMQYVRQSRWAEAQQSFFQAHRYAPENADYLFNLAVSLDHLGQRDAALRYYRKAIAAADAGAQHGFDIGAAGGRIDALTTGGKP